MPDHTKSRHGTMRRLVASTYPNYLAFLAILVGGLIYLFCRAENIRVILWIRETSLGQRLESSRESAEVLCTQVPAWVLYSLPDGLWSFAYAVIMTQLWGGHPGLVGRLWLMTIPLVGVGFELSQSIGWIPGTFSWLDLIFCTLGVVVGVSLRPRPVSSSGGIKS